METPESNTANSIPPETITSRRATVPTSQSPLENASWLTKNPSVLVSILALTVSCLALFQTHRSADIAQAQLRIASRPLLYGICDFTRSDFLKLSPIPDALMIAQPTTIDPPLQIQTLTRPLPIVPPYEKVLPWIVNRCSITNTGKGTAQDIEFDMTTMFISTRTQTPMSGKITQSVSIPFLASGESFHFLVGDLRAETALILMPQTVRYRVGLTGENVTEPLVHNGFWNQLTLDNRLKPKGLPPDQ